MAKGHQKSKQTSTLKFLKKFIKMQVKKYGDKVVMGVCSRMTTICPMQHAQATPAYISLHVVFGEIVHQGRSVLIQHCECTQTDSVKFNTNYTPHVGIYTFFTILFSPVHPYNFLRCLCIVHNRNTKLQLQIHKYNFYSYQTEIVVLLWTQWTHN